MKLVSVGVSPIARLQQRLRRQELSLARLKYRMHQDRLADQRLKLRLGGMLQLVDQEDLVDAELDNLCRQALNLLESSEDLDNLRAQGTNLLSSLELEKETMPLKSGQDEETRLAHVEQLIAKGGTLVKYRLQDFDQATVLGAFLKFTES